MRFSLLTILIFTLVSAPVYAWTDYANVRYMDFDGDLENEIIIESRHGAGTGHYIEDMRIYKDQYPKLELIFAVRTLDSYFDPSSEIFDIVSEVEFSEQTPENEGIRDIVVKSRKIYYKDEQNKVVDKEEELGTKVYKWNGTKFEEENE